MIAQERESANVMHSFVVGRHSVKVTGQAPQTFGHLANGNTLVDVFGPISDRMAPAAAGGPRRRGMLPAPHFCLSTGPPLRDVSLFGGVSQLPLCNRNVQDTGVVDCSATD